MRELLAECFVAIRGSVREMLPGGWELAAAQTLAGIDADATQRERDFFVFVDDAVFSREFAAKARAMKTVPLIEVR